jgi:hypothetical protein
LGNEAAGERLAAEPGVVFKTVIHPHPISKWKRLILVAVDLRHTSLHHVPGAEDIKELGATGAQLAAGAPGLIPEHHQDRLLAVFNGGFKPRHGRWGMMAEQQTLVAPRERGCTIALFADDTVRIRSWPALADATDRLRSYRQTPPCLLEQGQVHPDLVAHNERRWGGRDPKRKTRRRSALGIDASGRTLLYALGEETGPRDLAYGMKVAGASDAAQLDINWSWTRFLVFGVPAPEAELQVTSTLVPQMVHRRTGYVSRAVARDFFYLRRRTE